jgi:hypothetical protein
VFRSLPNIFKKESGYFIQNLQFKFLARCGCAKTQILARKYFFKLSLYHTDSSDVTQMNPFDHLHHCCQPNLV